MVKSVIETVIMCIGGVCMLCATIVLIYVLIQCVKDDKK